MTKYELRVCTGYDAKNDEFQWSFVNQSRTSSRHKILHLAQEAEKYHERHDIMILTYELDDDGDETVVDREIWEEALELERYALDVDVADKLTSE